MKATGCERGHTDLSSVSKYSLRLPVKTHGSPAIAQPLFHFMYLTVKLRVARTFKYSLSGLVGDIFYTLLQCRVSKCCLLPGGGCF